MRNSLYKQGANRKLYGDRKYEALERGLRELMRMNKQKIGAPILLFNGLRSDLSRDEGMAYLEYADGAMIEHFAGISAMNSDGTVKKEIVPADIEMMPRPSADKKMILVKAWPCFTCSYAVTSEYPPADSGKREATGPAERRGFTFERTFQHAHRRVDLEANRAQIDWTQPARGKGKHEP